MTWLNDSVSALGSLIETGGPVLILLVCTSILALAVFLFKLLQFRTAQIGRHKPVTELLKTWDRGERSAALTETEQTDHWLKDTLSLGMSLTSAKGARDRLEAEAEKGLMPLEAGFRILDMIAQLAPLLGLFGTVLGMIEAFQALQDAGDQVDPSILAGGIWVALLTTAAGLAVAMPTSVALSWLESRMDEERAFAGHAISVVLTPLEDTHAQSAAGVV